MDFSRIASAIDIEWMQAATISIIGAGGSAGLAASLVRSGGRRFKLFDPDVVTSSNIARQAHDTVQLGIPKVEALANMLRRINPLVEIETYDDDPTTWPVDEIALVLGSSNLLINATDRFTAHAWGNTVALRFGIPALWVGLYPCGLAGEVIWWNESIDACYRCLCAKRYSAHAQATASGKSLDPVSDGCTIFDISLLDSIAGMIAVGLITRGADNRFGRMIDELGNRNFIQIQLDSSWSHAGRNPIRELLGVAHDNSHYFAWNSIVRADPDQGRLPCPDCERFRGHDFGSVDGVPTRLKPIEGEGGGHA